MIEFPRKWVMLLEWRVMVSMTGTIILKQPQKLVLELFVWWTMSQISCQTETWSDVLCFTGLSAALRRADVGFVMGSGADVAKEVADIVILGTLRLWKRMKWIFGFVNFFLECELMMWFFCLFFYFDWIWVKMTIFRRWQERFCMDAQFSNRYASSLCSSPPSTLHQCVLYFWGHFLATIFLWPCKKSSREYHCDYLMSEDVWYAISRIQLLWVNLVMDTFAALAFGGEPPIDSYMDERPIKREANIINTYMWSSIIANGLYIAVLSIVFLTSHTVKVRCCFSLFYMCDIFSFCDLWYNVLGNVCTRWSSEWGCVSHSFFLLFHLHFKLQRFQCQVSIGLFPFNWCVVSARGSSGRVSGYEPEGCGFKSRRAQFFLTFSALWTSFYRHRTPSTNLTANLLENRNFLIVETFIFCVQVVMTYVGGKWLRTVGLHFSEWMTVTLLSITIIPFDLFRKVVIVPYLKRKRLGDNLRSPFEHRHNAPFHDFV